MGNCACAYMSPGLCKINIYDESRLIFSSPFRIHSVVSILAEQLSCSASGFQFCSLYFCFYVCPWVSIPRLSFLVLGRLFGLRVFFEQCVFSLNYTSKLRVVVSIVFLFLKCLLSLSDHLLPSIGQPIVWCCREVHLQCFADQLHSPIPRCGID